MHSSVLELPLASLHTDLLEKVRALVNEGELLPGARVPERELCLRFGISRTPLRECLKVLASEGLVELLPNRGARIATLDDAHLEHLFEVIAALEAEGGRLACQRIAADAVADIAAKHHAMHAHFLRQDLPGYFTLNQAIHDGIMRAAGNPLLHSTHATLAGRITRARYLSNRFHAGRWRTAMDEHAQILQLLTERDGPALGALLAKHLQNKRDIVIDTIRTMQKARA